MQGLMGGADAAGIHPRRHRLDALALARQDQASAIGAKWAGAVGVPQSQSQALDIRRKP